MDSEQVSLESFVEATERLCGPGTGLELVPSLRCQTRKSFELKYLWVRSLVHEEDLSNKDDFSEVNLLCLIHIAKSTCLYHILL